MANNCLVTKLKSVVDNPSLPVFEPLEEVSGIKTSEHYQYVDTLNYCTDLYKKNTLVEMDFTVNYVSNTSTFFGAKNNPFVIQQRNAILEPMYEDDEYTTGVELTNHTRYKMIINFNTGEVNINNTTYYMKFNSSFNSNSSVFLILLGVWGNGGTISSASKNGFTTIHNFKVTNTDINKVVLDLIPYKNKNGKGVLYDKVSGDRLYANTGDLVVVE